MKSTPFRGIKSFDWESLVGVIAAVAALVLDLLHIVEPSVLILIAVVLVALLFIRDMRREREDEQMHEVLERNAAILRRIESGLRPAEVDLVGPASIRVATEEFAKNAQGDMLWFNVCLLMFQPQWLFDLMLKPAIVNRDVTSITFILDPNQRSIWESSVLPKIQATPGAQKVQEPHWVPIDEMVSLILSKTHSSDGMECLLSFWGAPFMSNDTGRDVPRYVFLVHSHSDLVTHLSELARRYRLMTSPS